MRIHVKMIINKKEFKKLEFYLCQGMNRLQKQKLLMPHEDQ